MTGYLDTVCILISYRVCRSVFEQCYDKCCDNSLYIGNVYLKTFSCKYFLSFQRLRVLIQFGIFYFFCT